MRKLITHIYFIGYCFTYLLFLFSKQVCRSTGYSLLSAAITWYVLAVFLFLSRQFLSVAQISAVTHRNDNNALYHTAICADILACHPFGLIAGKK